MRFAVLVSGNGTNLQALVDAELGAAEIVLVVSNRPGVGALARAERAGIAAVVIDHREFGSRAEFEEKLLGTLREHRIESVILAGFMRVLTDTFVDAFENRIINTHPALCPAFPGINAPQQALDHGVRITGCTVHFVDRGVDTGPIIFQAAVEVRDDDTAATLHQRIQSEEHRLLPLAATLLASGRLRVDGRRVRIGSEAEGANKLV